jgi:rare lipoprotein A
MVGIASYYGDPKIKDYPLMANGKKFDPNNPKIAAHPSLKLGTKLKVLNLKNKKEICVIINDRMPKNHRIIDLSYAAAKKLKMLKKGLTKVKITVINNKEFYSRRCNETY